MLGLSTQTPPPLPSHADAVARAVASAGTVSGGYAGAPCAFHALGPDAGPLVAALLEAAEAKPEARAISEPGEWVLLTVQATREDGHRVHLLERSLTAAQRFMLTLACDGVESRWVAAAPCALPLRASGIDGRVPVGLIWCAWE